MTSEQWGGWIAYRKHFPSLPNRLDLSLGLLRHATVQMQSTKHHDVDDFILSYPLTNNRKRKKWEDIRDRAYSIATIIIEDDGEEENETIPTETIDKDSFCTTVIGPLRDEGVKVMT